MARDFRYVSSLLSCYTCKHTLTQIDFSGMFDEKDIIEIRCYDKEATAKESEGVITIPLKDFAKPGSYQKTYPLVAKTKGEAVSGFIDFEFQIEGHTNAQVFRCPLEVVLSIQKSKYPDLIIPIFVRRSIDFLRKCGRKITIL